MTNNTIEKLSDEQEFFINKALEGKNVLVDACIGSGKTTAIQQLCNRLPIEKKILYLTYNKLLKIDAKTKIKNSNVTVTNYHGYAYMVLRKAGISAAVGELVQTFNDKKPSIDKYDILIIDEYQDIEQELAYMLDYIKAFNPTIQLIAVGDMEQKIYDKTTLMVSEFIEQFLDKHIKLEFTRCFRLSNELASKLGRIWNKTIIGVNDKCLVDEMSVNDVINFLSHQEPQDILCLGARTGDLSKMLNHLEKEHSNKFNKATVYASISDRDSTGATQPKSDSAIFTTFDSSKGLERKICIVFDWTLSYWSVRLRKPQQSYEILRNIFCVAASRGKERIIFVKNDEEILEEKTISERAETNIKFEDVDISEMFDFKYKEDIEDCFKLLKISECSLVKDKSEIIIKNNDGLIDLSPCIGIYQEAVFFNDFNIDNSIDLWLDMNEDKKFLYSPKDKTRQLDEKILILTSLKTKQNRYRNQVNVPFVNANQKEMIISRIGEVFNPNENVQKKCSIGFSKRKNGELLFSARGMVDVIKDNIVYELKFVSELAHEHFLQCACYMIALGLKKGILWNTSKNIAYEIRITNETRFLNAVAKTITKGFLKKYFLPKKGIK